MVGGVRGSSLTFPRYAASDEQPSVLSQRLQVVRYDHRGHGDSPVTAGPYTVADLGRVVLELLDHLGIDRCPPRRPLPGRDGRDVAGRPCPGASPLVLTAGLGDTLECVVEVGAEIVGGLEPN